MREYNLKKSLKLVSNSKYFDPDTSRLFVRFGSPDSYQSRKIKIEGYEARLYWQFRYCQDHDGQAFFYTLTYNDKSMPKYLGQNVFDYEDLRGLLTGGFYQYLRRNYGTKFKYFVGAELGDGKGKRGMHNNPHYHVVFFLEPDANPIVPYKKISPNEFRHLVRQYWQGFDEDIDGYRDYNEAKYGIAKEGENCGLITDYRACCYCAKYVTKDAKLKQHEEVVRRKLFAKHMDSYEWSCSSYKEFFQDVVDGKVKTDLSIEWLSRLLKLENIVHNHDGNMITFIVRLGLKNIYHRYCTNKVNDMVDKDILVYRNRYCNKCRISQGVGLYALQFIDNKLNPVVQIPSKDGFKNRPLPLYLYRKLFTDVVRPVEDGVKYAPMRVLNDLGMLYKKSRLDSMLYKRYHEAKNILCLIAHNRELYDDIVHSDLVTNAMPDYEEFFQNYHYLLEKENNTDKLLHCYAEFKLVYEDRFFEVKFNGHDIDGSIPDIDVHRDYERFISPSYYRVSRSDDRIYEFSKGIPSGYVSYDAHPYFLRYRRIFDVLDLCTDYFFVQEDDRAQKEAEEIAATKRFHDRERLKEFYANFKN